MTTQPKLLIATNNPGKLKEIKNVLDGLAITLVSPAEVGLKLEIEEDGTTYAENAIKKATAFARASGLVTLGDDSGLEVDTLQGKPGLHSNRFGPQPPTDASRRRYLLEQLRNKPCPWTARFRATVALAQPDGQVRLVSGVCEGEIIPEERGNNGFGYDPLFLIPTLDKTMAQLNMREKNRLSHRGQAVQNAIPILKEIFTL